MTDHQMIEIESKKTMYLTSLLSETLPVELITDGMMSSLDLDTRAHYGLIHITFSNAVKTIIENKETHTLAKWKAELHEQMLAPLETDASKGVCILNLAPFTRTIVFSHHLNDERALEVLLRNWHSKVLKHLNEKHIGGIVAVSERIPYTIREIDQSYKRLRLLMDYRYIIGMNQLQFYQTFHFDNSYSITEYKYLQRFESLLSIESFEGLKAVVDEINQHIKQHMMNNSKVIYLYKELIAMLIKYLYKKETEYIEEILELNNAIMNFEDMFDDIGDVSDYLNTTLKAIKELSDEHKRPFHPHVKKVLQMIDETYQEDIGLNAIADELRLSSAHLSRLFKEEVAIGFKEYLTKYRLKKIKDLLNHTSKSIHEIAIATGYKSANQMTRIFKKYEQMTPSEFRHLKHF